MKDFSLIIIGLLYLALLPAQSELDSLFKTLEEDPVFRHSGIFAEVRVIDSTRRIFTYNGHKAAKPASSLKLVSSLLLLNQLGDEFRYITPVGYSGTINKKGELNGDLIIIASGDPSLGSKRFSGNPSLDNIITQISFALQKQGITSIKGKIILDLTAFDTEYVHPSWEWGDLGLYYGAGIFALNINENEFEMQIDATGNIGEMANIVSVSPTIPTASMKLEIMIESEMNAEGVAIMAHPEANVITFKGTVSKRKKPHTVRASIPDPPDLFLFYLQKMLDSTQIKYQEITKLYSTSADTSAWTRLITFSSPPLSQLIAETNKHSLNLYSEAFLKTIALKNGKKGTRKNGNEIIESHLKRLGLDIRPIKLKDGSGLSPQNLISANILAGLIDTLTRANGAEKYTGLLPLAGKEGTVKPMLKDTPAYGKVWMKSGSISNVLSYTGICLSKSGKWCSFSIIFNNSSVDRSTQRSKMSAIINKIYDSL